MIDKKTILVVEDENDLAFLLKRKFENEGFAVELALNGEEALEKVSQKKPDLILLDLLLPIVNGFEVLKKLQTSEETKNIKVVVLTNLSGDEDIAEVLKSGGTDYLIKADNSLDDIVANIKNRLS